MDLKVRSNNPPRVHEFMKDRFGLSLHFGAYSVPARSEWIRVNEQLSVEDYQGFVDSFNPEPGWAKDWVAMAKKAGARYGVLTTKHHDGFCLFDSSLTDYKTSATRCGRDLVKEWVDAMSEAGLKVGLYYSLLDWHHPDYPAWQDRQHPLRHRVESERRDAMGKWDRYVEYMHGQVRELCTLYGRLDLLVFDFSYWDFYGEKWRASELVSLIRRLQPDVLINDRLGREAIKQEQVPDYAGDYDQCEQDIPRAPVTDTTGRQIPWESWITLNNSWCFNPNDQEWKSATTVLRALINCVSKNGNLLLNVSPDARGRVPSKALTIMQELGEWIEANGESIYGAGASSWPKPEWGRFTQKAQYLYAHLLEPVIGHVSLPGMRGCLKDGRVLASGAEAVLCDYWNPGIQTFDDPSDIFFNLGKPIAYSFVLPDPRSTVIRFELTEAAEQAQIIERLSKEKATAIERTPFK